MIAVSLCSCRQTCGCIRHENMEHSIWTDGHFH